MAELPPCGTNSRYQWHLKLGEEIDDACKEASRTYHAEYRRRHPETVKRVLLINQARGAARARLALRYPDAYAELLAEERSARGLPPARNVTEIRQASG